MKKSSIITILCLVAFGLLIFLPPIIHGYVYPSLGDDTAGHLQIFDGIASNINNGMPLPKYTYLGQLIVGYPLVLLSKVSGASIDTLFLWFNFIVLFIVGLSCYFVLSRLVNRVAGLFALFLPVFCAQGLMFLFYTGTIFNIISIGIILMWAVYFTVKWFKERRNYQLALAILLAVLFSIFHVSGLYLFPAVVLAVIALVIYRIRKRQKIGWGKVIIGLGIVGAVFACIWFLSPSVRNSIRGIFNSMVWGSKGSPMSVPIGMFFSHVVSTAVIMVLLFAIVVVVRLKLRGIKAETKYLVYALVCLMIPLIPTAFINELAQDVARQAFALATLFAILGAVFAGLVWEIPKARLLVVGLALIAIVGGVHNAVDWFGYNSAVRQIDKDAIAYVNMQDAKTYSCNVGVAYWVYDRFIDAEYVPSDGDILIQRNLAQTPQCDPNDFWYLPHGIETDVSYRLIASIGQDKDGTMINIYKRVGD